MFKNAKWRSSGKGKYQLKGYQYNNSFRKGYYKLTLGRVGKHLAMYDYKGILIFIRGIRE